MPLRKTTTDWGDLTIINFAQVLAPGADQDRRKTLAGSNKADFERAVSGELAVLYRVARRLGAGPEEAEDLVQAAVYKAFRSWHQFDGRYLRSWLVRILRNEWLAGLRTQKPEADWDEVVEESIVERPFWSKVEANLEVAAILHELERLPEPYRMAVQLCDVEQMSYEEAATAMDVPVGTVRSRLFRARMELRKRLGGSV